MSTGRECELAPTDITLFSSETLNPDPPTTIRLMPPGSLLLDERERMRASTITSLPEWVFTKIDPLIRLAFTVPGRDGLLNATCTRSAGASCATAATATNQINFFANVLANLFTGPPIYVSSSFH